MAPTQPPVTLETLEGWGMHDRGACRVAHVTDSSQIAGVFAEAASRGETVAMRGAGCSYGDAALNTGQVALDCTAMRRILAWDPETGIVTAEPGVTIAQLWQRILPDGWWPTVVPGTSAVTLGGAAAMNIHGKNNWRVGSFGDSVLSFDLLLPTGETLTCSRTQHPDVFAGAIGGMGLLGCFVSITMQTRRIFSGYVSERQTAHDSLEALLAALEAATSEYDDVVAWLDTSARGAHLGRGLLKAGRDLEPGEDPHPEASLSVVAQLGSPGMIQRASSGWLPRLARGLATAPGVWLANRGQWARGRAASRGEAHLATYARANFPLDAVPNWRDAYRPGGLIQHQSFVPREAALPAFRDFLARSQAAGVVPSLAVLKKHRPDDFLLSYLGDGYSLALDFPVRRGQEARLLSLQATLNDLLADYGGRCYFAKDSTLTSSQAERMIAQGTLARFVVLKQRCDPSGLLATDLYRRVLAPLLQLA